MLQEHWRIWTCPFGCRLNFQSSNELRSHTIEAHPRQISIKRLEDLVSLSSKADLTRAQGKCSLCLTFDINNSRMYESHVGNHLEQLALFALPQAHGDEYEQDDSTENDQDSDWETGSGDDPLTEVEAKAHVEAPPRLDFEAVDDVQREQLPAGHGYAVDSKGARPRNTKSLDSLTQSGPFVGVDRIWVRNNSRNNLDNNRRLRDLGGSAGVIIMREGHAGDGPGGNDRSREINYFPTHFWSSRTCKVVGCTRRHVYDMVRGKKMYSEYCQEHTCQAPRNYNTGFCINSRSPANRYCTSHGTCNRGCTVQASRSEKQPFPYICPFHRCAIPDCFSPRWNQQDVCKLHTTCLIQGCPQRPQRSRNILFCPTHSCDMVSSCPRPAVVPGARHCNRHIPCAKSNQGCRQIAIPPSKFCSSHVCVLKGCANNKEEGFRYCSRHTCRIVDCHQAVLHVGYTEARYCSSHVCALTGCLDSAQAPTAVFCHAHTCAHRGCKSPRNKPSSPYCAGHRCGLESCRNHAVDRSSYCQYHTCAEADCKEPVMDGRASNGRCRMHWLRGARVEVAHVASYSGESERQQLEWRYRDRFATEEERLLRIEKAASDEAAQQIMAAQQRARQQEEMRELERRDRQSREIRERMNMIVRQREAEEWQREAKDKEIREREKQGERQREIQKIEAQAELQARAMREVITRQRDAEEREREAQKRETQAKEIQARAMREMVIRQREAESRERDIAMRLIDAGKRERDMERRRIDAEKRERDTAIRQREAEKGERDMATRRIEAEHREIRERMMRERYAGAEAAHHDTKHAPGKPETAENEGQRQLQIYENERTIRPQRSRDDRFYW